MRKFIVAALVIAAPASVGQTASDPASNGFQFRPYSEVDTVLAKPQPGRTLSTAMVSDHHDKGYYVEFVRRFNSDNDAEVHTEWADQITIVGGEGVLTYGGTVSNPRKMSATEIRGDGQVGATTKKLSAGDYMLIPPGLPHTFDAARGKTLTYVIFKVRP